MKNIKLADQAVVRKPLPFETSSFQLSSSYTEAVVLFGIVSLALIFRIWGVDFGLPYRYHPDESQHVAEAAQMLVARSLEPRIFNNPPFYKYLLVIADAVYAGVSLLFGRYGSLDELASSLSLDPSPLYLLARIISAIAGTLTVFVSYLIGKTAYERRVGLLASLFLAVAFLHVRDSHFAVNDALLVLLIAIAVLASVKLVRQTSLPWAFIGAGAAGLAFSTKYTAVFVILTVTAAFIVTFYKDSTRKLVERLGILVAVWCTFAAFAVLGSPYFLLKPLKVYESIRSTIYIDGMRGLRGWQLDTAGAYLYYLKSLMWGIGPVLTFFVLCGCCLALIRHRKMDLLLLTYPVLLYLFMARQEMYFARFLLPAYPMLLVLASACIVSMVSYRRAAYSLHRYNLLNPAVLLIVVTLAAVVQPTIQSIRLDYLLTQTDTRTLAKNWIEANIPEGTKIAVDWPYHGPSLSTVQSPEPHSARTYELLIVSGSGLADHSLAYYRTEGVQYLVTSSNISNIAVADVEREKERQRFYDQLEVELDVVQVFAPHASIVDTPFVFDQVLGPMLGLWQIDRPGPTIKIYQLEKTEQATALEQLP